MTLYCNNNEGLKGLTSVIPAMVATKELPTDPRGTYQITVLYRLPYQLLAMIYITANPFLIMEFSSFSSLASTI